MALQDYTNDMFGCSRCSLCKWIPQNQVKSWRFAKGCPSMDRYHFHAYSGSGRMIMGMSMLDGRSELGDAVAEIIYKCQLCGACQVACMAVRDDIDIADVLLEERTRCVEEGFLLPEHMEFIESMKREDNTLGMLKADRGNWAKGLDIPDINLERVEVLFHAGCRYSYDEDLMETVRNAVALLKKGGVKAGIAGRDEACCGGRAYETGYQGEMKKYADDMAGRVKASGAAMLVTPCADCYYTFKYLYPRNGMSLNVEVLHITELADRLLRAGAIKPKKTIPMKVTYHDPCHLGRRGEAYRGGWSGENKLDRPIRFKQSGERGVFEPPRNIIRSIPGIEFTEMERIREWSYCCGAGGGVLEAFPEFAGWTARERMEEAASTGAEALVTACPWCVRLFQDTIREMGNPLKVIDVTELLMRSLGGK
jgi:Fe-S oxidoreductase